MVHEVGWCGVGMVKRFRCLYGLVRPLMVWLLRVSLMDWLLRLPLLLLLVVLLLLLIRIYRLTRVVILLCIVVLHWCWHLPLRLRLYWTLHLLLCVLLLKVHPKPWVERSPDLQDSWPMGLMGLGE